MVRDTDRDRNTNDRIARSYLVHNPEDDGFLAYVNFEKAGCAKKIRRDLGTHLRKEFGKRLNLDPTGVLRDQEGKYIPDRFNRIAMAYGDRHRSVSPRSTHRRRSLSPRPRRDKKQSSKRYRERSISSEGESKKRTRGPRTPSDSPSRSPTESGYVENLEELSEHFPSTWKVFGKEYFLQELLRDVNGNSLKLTISQRLPLDDVLYQKMMDFDKKQLALMVAVEGEPSSATGLDKAAAGIAPIENGVVYIFAASQIQANIVKFFAPRIAIIKPDSNYLLIAVKKNPSTNAKSQGDSENSSQNTKSNEVKQEASINNNVPIVTSKKEPQTPPEERNGHSDDNQTEDSDESSESRSDYESGQEK